MKVYNFKDIEQQSGMNMKLINTVVEKWPQRLKLRYGRRGAQEEFDAAMACPPQCLKPLYRVGTCK